MTRLELPYLNAQRGRDGRLRYWYFRRNGRRWQLPGALLSEEFMEEYRRLLKATEPKAQSDAPADRRAYPAGSFGARITDYLASGEFKDKKPSTQGEYRRVLEGLQKQHGHRLVRDIRRRHVRRMMRKRKLQVRRTPSCGCSKSF